MQLIVTYRYLARVEMMKRKRQEDALIAAKKKSAGGIFSFGRKATEAEDLALQPEVLKLSKEEREALSKLAETIAPSESTNMLKLAARIKV